MRRESNGIGRSRIFDWDESPYPDLLTIIYDDPKGFPCLAVGGNGMIGNMGVEARSSARLPFNWIFCEIR